MGVDKGGDTHEVAHVLDICHTLVGARGQRSLLAIFCVAVGVMAIVGLQLVSDAVTNALVGDVRAINGGDVALDVTNTTPLTSTDLTFFDQLKSQGSVTAYAALDLQQGQAPK